MEIKLPGDLKEIPTKLETFTSTISSLSSQVVELKNIQWKLPAEFQGLLNHVSLVQEKLKTLDSLPSLLNKVIDTLTRFTTMVENASGATHNNVPLVGQPSASPAKREKNTTKDAETNLQNELVNLLGIDMVEQYNNKKLLFDKYCDKMLKRRKSSKIINCDVLAQKGPILLKVYKKDWKIEVQISKSVTYIWLNGERLYKLIDFNKPLKEQDPLNELNDLANKKRKRTGDSTDHSRSTKKHKSSAQHEEDVHLGTRKSKLCKKKLLCSLTIDFNLASDLQVLRRLGSIFASVYAAVQKLKKETMTTVNQGMSVEEIERVISQRVANAIEAIAIYEMKTNLSRTSMSQTKRQEEKVAENASNKRKWESNHNESLSQQNKGHKYKSHHSGPCTVKCRNCKKVGHIIQNCRTSAIAKNQRTRSCYECGSLRHYKSECPIVKFHKRVDMIYGRMRASKPKTMQVEIEITTKLRNKKISTLVGCPTENKKRLDNTSKNNQNQQQPNKRQNTGRAYTARHGEKKHYSGSKPLCSK
nr:hypothetical protein [Tanacetum cinerariifolium]